MQTEQLQLVENTMEKTSFLKKLSNGDISLGYTFWLYGCLIRILVNSLSALLAMGILAILDYKPLSYMLAFVIILPALIYNIVALVAIWRSATKHTGFILWGILAKCIVVLNVIIYAYYIVGGSILPSNSVQSSIYYQDNMNNMYYQTPIQPQSYNTGEYALDNLIAQSNFPAMADKITQINSIEKGTKKYTYDYTILYTSVKDIDVVYFQNTLQQQILWKACNTLHTKEVMEQGYQLIHDVKDGWDVPITKIVVSISSCSDPSNSI